MMPSLIHRPTPTRTIDSANGIRQPQVANWSPDHVLAARITRLDRNRPAGTPNCGHDAMKPRWSWVRDHSIASSTEPPHSPPTPMPWRVRRIVRMIAPQIPIDLVGRDEGDQERRDAHAQQRRDQCRLAADAVAVMAENRRPDRPADEADEVGAERGERAGQRVFIGKIELAEDQSGRGAVDEEVVPLDGGADGRGDHRSAKLRCCAPTRKVLRTSPTSRLPCLPPGLCLRGTCSCGGYSSPKT